MEAGLPITPTKNAAPSVQHDKSFNTEINVARHLFPLCIVWTPIPLLSWLFPFVGHMGIAGSDGRIKDFAGDYYVSEDNMAFGWPVAYCQLLASKATGGSSGFDKAVRQASEEYGERHQHNLLWDNCHSFVARALNLCAYDGRTNWNMVTTCLHMFSAVRFTSFAGFAKQFGPTTALLTLGGIGIYLSR